MDERLPNADAMCFASLGVMWDEHVKFGRSYPLRIPCDWLALRARCSVKSARSFGDRFNGYTYASKFMFTYDGLMFELTKDDRTET